MFFEIRADIQEMLISARKHSETNLQYSLLQCRMATEAILMLKHLEILNEMGDGRNPKKMLTLGDLNNPKLKFREFFDPMQIMAIQFIQNATNPHLHYQREELPNRDGLVERVLEEIDSILEVVSKDSKLGKGKLHGEWKHKLDEEIDSFNWKLKGTILNSSGIKSRLQNYQTFKTQHEEKMKNGEWVKSKREYNKQIKSLQHSIDAWSRLEEMSEQELLMQLKHAVKLGLIQIYYHIGASRKLMQQGIEKGKKKGIRFENRQALNAFYMAISEYLGIPLQNSGKNTKWDWIFSMSKKGVITMSPHFQFLNYY